MNASRRRTTTTRSGVVAGSVWESRMKIDEVKGGIKVFNGEESQGDSTRLKRNRSAGTVEKRRTWKSVDGIEKNPIPIRKTKSASKRFSDEKCKEFGGSREKMVSKSLSNVGLVRSRKLGGGGDDDGGDGDDADDHNFNDDDDEDEEDDEFEKDVEIEKKSIDIKEVNSSEEKLKPKMVSSDEKKIDQIHGSMVLGEEKKMNQILGSMGSSQEKKIDQKKIDQVQEKEIEQKKIDQVLGSMGSNQEKEIDQIHEIHEMPITQNVHKILRPTIDHPAIDRFLTKPQVPIADGEPFEIAQETHNRMQNIVDLVMWRDMSKSAFIFGLGTFTILSSSFATDLNFSLISAISYLGLVYLAAIYLFKSIICRGVIDIEDVGQNYVVGEKEAIWLLKLILPYINELLFKLRGLFSGDPATTMKLSVFLFVLARCGSSITIWKMAKLAFFAIFTVPKICSSYSAQLTGYGKFWIRRFRDAWDSCSQKKAVAAAVFTVIWNLSSIVARIWAVFMLIVAVRCYQQSTREEWVEEVGQVREDSTQGQEQRQRQRHRQRWKVSGPGPTTLMDLPKEKKGS